MNIERATLLPMERTREYRRGEKARATVLGIRFSPREREIVMLAAKEQGTLVSQYCRDAILRAAMGRDNNDHDA